MTNVIPSTLIYEQIKTLLADLENALEGDLYDSSTSFETLSSILTKIQEDVGTPFVEEHKIVFSEPPSSKKHNRFTKLLSHDVNLMQKQLDMLRSATVYTHNSFATEISSLQDQNARLGNKVKTLQLYSGDTGSGMIIFGDTFISRDFLDDSLVPPEERVAMPSAGYVTLRQEGAATDLTQESSLTLMNTSNGFLGNNQEIEDPDPSASEYTFIQQKMDTKNLDNIKDGEPDTWIEYESNYIDPEDRRQALNYNFSYISNDEEGNSKKVNWALGPDNDKLNMDLEFDFGSVKNLNSISIRPFGLSNNSNYPIRVRSVQTSANKTDWFPVRPEDIWISNELNIQAARSAASSVLGSAFWTFETRSARYVRIYLEQHYAVPSNIGHVYWVQEDNNNIRLEGPNPPIEDTGMHLDKLRVGDLLQAREYFEGRRWVIGIRDVSLIQNNYMRRSSFVTRPMRVAGLVDRVALDKVEYDVPDEFDSDQHWVRFYISPDDGVNWYQIARIDDPVNGIPQQISFNDPLDISLREPGIKNYTTNSPVRSIRLKVEMERPEDLVSTTPILKSYRIKVLKK